MSEILTGLPFKEKVKRIFNEHKRNLFDKIKVYIKDYNQEIIFILNYLISGIGLGILIFLIMGIWFNFSFLRFMSTILGSSIFLLFFEYYYVWLRQGWKEYGIYKK